MPDVVTSNYRVLQAKGALHTITVKYPRALAAALNRSVGQAGEATHQQIDTWLRDIVAVNVEALMQEHAPETLPPKKLKARVRRATASP